ncbi:hypothetical protein SLA2020_070870 [Shorea laevis]
MANATILACLTFACHSAVMLFSTKSFVHVIIWSSCTIIDDFVYPLCAFLIVLILAKYLEKNAPASLVRDCGIVHTSQSVLAS